MRKVTSEKEMLEIIKWHGISILKDKSVCLVCKDKHDKALIS